MHHPPSHAKHCRGEFAELDVGDDCEEGVSLWWWGDFGDTDVLLENFVQCWCDFCAPWALMESGVIWSRYIKLISSSTVYSLHAHKLFYLIAPLSSTSFPATFIKLSKSPTKNNFTQGSGQFMDFQSKEGDSKLGKVLKKGVYGNFGNEGHFKGISKAFQRQPKNSELSGHSCCCCCIFHPQMFVDLC